MCDATSGSSMKRHNSYMVLNIQKKNLICVGVVAARGSWAQGQPEFNIERLSQKQIKTQHCRGEGEIWGDRIGERGRYDHISLYTCMKFSN